MTTKASVPQVIGLTPGCQPSTDRTALSTPHSVMSDKIRWFQGFPQKIGGWQSIAFNYGAVIVGACRSIFSAFLSASTSLITVLGTSQNLYAMNATQLVNITPLNVATTAIANSLTSDYRNLPANPLTTVINSGTITVHDPSASQYQAGDDITLSGCATVNGLTPNGTYVIRSINTSASTYTITLATNATASGTGGGSACYAASGLITVAAVAHGQTNGQRTKITGAAAFAGLTTIQINKEFIVRGALTNSFQIMTAGTATSSAAAGGGAGTLYQTQLIAGIVNEGAAQGYGAGFYGVGLYGTGLISQNGRTFPTIWFIDRFQATLIMTRGNSSGVYNWNGDTTVAPALLANAPTDINYAFESNDIVVTFGHQGVGNQIFASDQENPTIWTASSTNQVFQDVISGCGPLISHAKANGTNLIFSQNETYIFTYIGLPLIWDIQLLSEVVGIIAPLARVTVNGVPYWMGQHNFYRWRGADIEIVPANSQEVSTIYNYVFQNLTANQRSKVFAWYNERYGEVWFHYPDVTSNECNMVARVNVHENFVWTPDTFDRTAAEYPAPAPNPRLISSSNVLYNHEIGNDADGQPMPWSLVSNLRHGGKASKYVSTIVPDSSQSGDINMHVDAYEYPQSPVATNSRDYTITPETPFLSIDVGGRYWQYTWSGSELGQNWTAGTWQEYVQEASIQ